MVKTGLLSDIYSTLFIYCSEHLWISKQFKFIVFLLKSVGQILKSFFIITSHPKDLQAERTSVHNFPRLHGVKRVCGSV